MGKRSNLEHRLEIERHIGNAIVKEALDAGYAISINNGEDETEPMRDATAITKALRLTDDERLYLWETGATHAFAWVYLVYGNDGWDVVNDYTTNIEQMMKGISQLADRLETNERKRRAKEA